MDLAKAFEAREDSFGSATDSCKEMANSCRDMLDSCKEVEGSCRELADSCKQLVDCYSTLQTMAADLLASWERFKVQQAAATSSPTTTTTPPPTSTTPPPTTTTTPPPTSTTPPPTPPPQATPTPAAPATLPLLILERVQAELVDYRGSGMSIMEMSHRGKEFDAAIKKAEADLRTLLSIPDTHEVLFLQGSASTQFSAVLLNLCASPAAPADYLVSGSWSDKAFKETTKFSAASVA